MKQNGNGEGSPAFVAEGALKPQFDEDLVESSVKIETLAGWERVTRKAMLNIPGFISFLQSRMIEKLYKAEDAGILYGTGVSPEIKGILTAGNFTASTSTASTLVERITDDLARIEDSFERSANIILLRPLDYFSFFKNKASGSGEYDLPFNVQIVNGQLFISGVPVKSSTALLSTDYMVGDLNGANFLTQENMRIEFFEQDGDNVQKNKVTIRIEESVALPVYGANYFVKGNKIGLPV
jgi:HK97 family phage major capsid protein